MRHNLCICTFARNLSKMSTLTEHPKSLRTVLALVFHWMSNQNSASAIAEHKASAVSKLGGRQYWLCTGQFWILSASVHSDPALTSPQPELAMFITCIFLEILKNTNIKIFKSSDEKKCRRITLLELWI